MKQLAIGVLVFACSQAWAINKCTGPDGKTVFQDVPCAGIGKEIDVKPASGNDNKEAAAAARARFNAPRVRETQENIAQLEALERGRAAMPTRAKNCPSAHEIRNMETSANSIFVKGAERRERLRQIGEAKQCSH